MSNPKRAFISHCSPDDRYVAEFVQLVRSLGYDQVFNDSHTIKPDVLFWERIEQGIRECDAFVVILSQASVKSYWVDKEVQFARREGKSVIPIRIDDCTLPASFDGRDVIELKHAGKGQRLSPPRFIHHAAEHFLGREPQLALLDEAWTNCTNVFSIIAWGGGGKTALITEWVQTRFIEKQWKTDDGRPALAAYFDWTFYDQGTRSLGDGTEARTGSVGDFFEQALVFFGDPDPNLPGKGRRLTDLIRQQRSLIILDGLEPLQQPPGHPQAGRLLDPDLRDLLASLAQSNPGLCLITSRQALTDLHALRRTVHREHELEDLPVAIAIRLLRQLQIKGTDKELAEASEKFGCHALSLTLLGRYLFDAHGGDIARTDRIRDLQRADTLTREDRHRTAWRVLETYESWLATAQADGNPKTLAVLRLTGLFDRAATADCLAPLRSAPIIPGLTDAICGMANDEWNILLKRLERAHLIKLRESTNLGSQIADQLSIDAHPLIREYFAKQLKQAQFEAFKAAHSRLFDHLCKSTKYQPDTLSELTPLYQAVAHGCFASRQQEAALKVFRERILRSRRYDGFYSWKKLGSIGADLGALASFYINPWNKLLPNLSVEIQNEVLSDTSIRLRAMGRLKEAFEPMIVTTNFMVAVSNYEQVAISASNLSELELVIGDLTAAIENGRRAIKYADWCDNENWQWALRTTAATAFSHAGQLDEAMEIFVEAEKRLARAQPQFPKLYSLFGFRYIDHVLVLAERNSWLKSVDIKSARCPFIQLSRCLTDCAETMRRVEYCFATRQAHHSLLTIGLDHVSSARSSLYIAILKSVPNMSLEIASLPQKVALALATMRQANDLTYLPIALLTAAFYHGTLGENLEEAERLLEEAQQIAERGPMPLYLADVHLHRARLFGRLPKDERQEKFPDIDPKAELAEARRLIEKHGYWRRKEELEDAEAAAIHW